MITPTTGRDNSRLVYFKCWNAGSDTFTLIRASSVKDANDLFAFFDRVVLPDNKLPGWRLFDLKY